MPIWLFAVLLAAEWPQFRGPNGSGVSPSAGLPAEFGPHKNMRWRTALPPGHSSPVLTRDRIFLTAFEGDKLLTLCLDRDSGKILWRREAPRNRKESFQPTNTPATPTPVTDGTNVFVFFGDFGLISYGRDGNERWRLPLGPFNNVNGHGSSPILAGGKLVVLCDQDTDSYVLAVDPANGKVLWKTARPEVTRGYATPGVYQPKSGPAEVVVPGAFQVASYSLDTGEKLWWVLGMAWQLKSVPLIDGDRIYVSGWEAGGDSPQGAEVPPFSEMLARYDTNHDGKLSPAELPDARDREWMEDNDLDKDGYIDARDWSYRRARHDSRNNIIAIKGGGRGDITNTHVLWRYAKSIPNTPSPLLYKGVLFLFKEGGIVTSLDPATGQVFKQARLKGALGQYWSSPVAADGRIYIANETGKVSVLKADPQWEVLAINDLGEDCFATPAIVDGRLYVRTKNALYCFAKPDSR